MQLLIKLSYLITVVYLIQIFHGNHKLENRVTLSIMQFSYKNYHEKKGRSIG